MKISNVYLDADVAKLHYWLKARLPVVVHLHLLAVVQSPQAVALLVLGAGERTWLYFVEVQPQIT